MGKLSVLEVIKQQWSKEKPPTRKDLTGQTVVVLGANVGLGFESAKHFATMNPGKLILACRSKAKGDEAVRRIQAETGSQVVELIILDLANLASVSSFAERFNQQESRLDILIANAAVASSEYSVTKDGWETTVQVNHLATAMTTILLLPKMIATAKEHNTTPRITVVASGIHFWTELDNEILNSHNILEKMSSKEYCSKAGIMNRRYPDSKLFNVFFVRSIASQLAAPSPVVIDSADPGYFYSSLRREFSGIRLLLDRVMETLLAWTPERASRQVLYAALGGKDEEMHGSYLSTTKITEPSDFVIGKGEETQRRLWNETITILSKHEPKVQEIVTQHLTRTAV